MKRMAMKVHLLVWAVVLSISSISRGENVTSVSAGDATGAPDASSPSPRETSGPPATQTAANRSDRGPAVSTVTAVYITQAQETWTRIDYSWFVGKPENDGKELHNITTST
uniref:Uncharacterized protein n=1 Tax=Gasterosteus aculeatus TaxID=69293 RepID=G3Q432_GASAC